MRSMFIAVPFLLKALNERCIKMEEKLQKVLEFAKDQEEIFLEKSKNNVGVSEAFYNGQSIAYTKIRMLIQELIED